LGCKRLIPCLEWSSNSTPYAKESQTSLQNSLIAAIERAETGSIGTPSSATQSKSGRGHFRLCENRRHYGGFGVRPTLWPAIAWSSALDRSRFRRGSLPAIFLFPFGVLETGPISVTSQSSAWHRRTRQPAARQLFGARAERDRVALRREDDRDNRCGCLRGKPRPAVVRPGAVGPSLCLHGYRYEPSTGMKSSLPSKYANSIQSPPSSHLSACTCPAGCECDDLPCRASPVDD
jgi:hypothetical protein